MFKTQYNRPITYNGREYTQNITKISKDYDGINLIICLMFGAKKLRILHVKEIMICMTIRHWDNVRLRQR